MTLIIIFILFFKLCVGRLQHTFSFKGQSFWTPKCPMLKLVDTSYDIWIHTGLTSFGLDDHWTPYGEGRPQDSNE